MAELQGYRGQVLIYNSTTATFAVGSSARVYVFSEGANLNGAQALGTGVGVSATIFDPGSFAISDYAQVGVSGPIYQVTAVGATTLTLTYVSGTTGTFADGTRILNIGTAVDKSASHATIYPVDQDTSTAVTQPKTCDSGGNFIFFATTGDYDLLIQNSSGADLYIDPDISLMVVGRSSALGLVYLQSVTDDFSVGGATLASSAFYVDESAELVYIGGNSGNRIQLDGSAGDLTIVDTAAQPTIILTNSTGFNTVLTPSTTGSSKTITFPDATGTVLLTAGTQTITGALTVTGGLTVTTTATSMTSALQSTSSAYFQAGLVVGTTNSPTTTGDLQVKRLKVDQGTALTTSAVALSSTWGSTATKALSTNATDQRFKLTVTAGGTGLGASPTATITFADGTFTNAPNAIVVNNGGTISPGVITWTTTATTLVITWSGTPTAGQTGVVEVQILG